MLIIDLGSTEVAVALLMLSFTIILGIISLIIYSNRDRYPHQRERSHNEKL